MRRLKFASRWIAPENFLAEFSTERVCQSLLVLMVICVGMAPTVQANAPESPEGMMSPSHKNPLIDHRFEPIADVKESLTLTYIGYLGEFRVGEVTALISVGRSKYVIDIRAKTIGFFDTITSYRTYSAAQGEVRDRDLIPAIYVSHTSRNFGADYDSEVVFAQGVLDRWKTSHKNYSGQYSGAFPDMIPKAVDPLTLLLSLIQQNWSGDPPCVLERNISISSRVVAQFYLEELERVSPTMVESAIYSEEPATVCKIHLERAERINPDDEAEPRDSQEPPEEPMIYFQSLGSDKPTLPIAAKFPMRNGNSRIFLIGFDYQRDPTHDCVLCTRP